MLDGFVFAHAGHEGGEVRVGAVGFRRFDRPARHDVGVGIGDAAFAAVYVAALADEVVEKRHDAVDARVGGFATALCAAGVLSVV